MNRIPTIADVLMRQHESDNIYIGDTPEQLGTIQAADAIMIDGKIVTREDVRKLQQERNELAATVEELRKVTTERESEVSLLRSRCRIFQQALISIKCRSMEHLADRFNMPHEAIISVAVDALNLKDEE